MRKIAPRISIISAGKSDPAHHDSATGKFHAFQFGHPRESAVKIIEAGTTDNRKQPVSVTTMDRVKTPHENRKTTKAVYCTCWDGDIVVEVDAAGTTPIVKPPQ